MKVLISNPPCTSTLAMRRYLSQRPCNTIGLAASLDFFPFLQFGRKDELKFKPVSFENFSLLFQSAWGPREPGMSNLKDPMVVESNNDNLAKLLSDFNPHYSFGWSH